MAPVGVRKQYYRDEDALIMWVHDIDGAEYAAGSQRSGRRWRESDDPGVRDLL
jgi:hypothetical protein